MRAVIAAATRFVSMVRVQGSMSTNIGVAPVYRIAAAVAMNVKGTVITSSPGPAPAARRARWRALVPELTAMPCPAPQ